MKAFDNDGPGATPVAPPRPLDDPRDRVYPDRPGVYLMKDSGGKIIYVGKARSLRNRVRSYFNGEKDIKTRFLLANMADIEVIITNTEYEALILENNLIKQWKPQYNIDLKDGKTYPVIRITAEEFPRVYRTRRMIFDGSEYFGPFPKPQQIDIYLRLIERHFPLCKYRGSRRTRAYPCLNYHMGRCSGACAGKISREDYQKIVDGVRKLLSGRSDELLKELREKMRAASDALEFERAAKLRDQISAIEEVSVEQRVMEFTEEDRDYIAMAPCGSGHDGKGGAPYSESLVVVVLQVREGKLLGKEVFQVSEWSPDEEALSHFITRYYGERKSVPDAVYVGADVDTENLAPYLKEIAGRQIAVKIPQRGKHTQLLSMAQENAREEAAKASRGAAMTQALEGLRLDLGLPAQPRRIEGFDIAHLEGTDTIASMVRFTDGKPDRKLYRAFSIRSLGGKIDDFESLREAVARRYTRVVNEELDRPDLILIDGGKGQLSAARGILLGIGLGDIPVIGLAKKQEEIFLPGREDALVLDEASPSLRLLEAVRNESHRFATKLNKRRRTKKLALTVLEGVPGVGQARSRRVMEVFGSVEAILGATVDDIQKKAGLPRATAAMLLARLSERYSRPSGGEGAGGDRS
ncbi:MAG TPA: excinuclease ABC subunit UvrC [Spirochaetia bacterium]